MINEAYEVYKEYVPNATKEQFEEAYLGAYDKPEDWAYEIVADMELNDFALRYFDYAKFVKDCQYDGYIFDKRGYVYDGRI